MGYLGTCDLREKAANCDNCVYDIINYFNSVPQLQFLCFNCFGNRDIKLHLAKTVVWSAGRSTKNQFELFPPCPSTSDACSALPCQRHASSDRRLPCSLRELKSTERSRKPVRTPPTASGYLRCLLKLWSSPQEGVYCQDPNEALKVFRE